MQLTRTAAWVLALAGASSAQPFVQAVTQDFTATINLATGTVINRLSGGRVAAVTSKYLFIGGAGLAQYEPNAQLPFTTAMPGLPPQALVATSDSSHVYFVSAVNTVVWDPNARRIVATIPIGAGKGKAALSADGKRLYITIGNHIIDTATNTIIRDFDAPNSDAIVLSPDGSFAYVGNTVDAPGSICNVPDAVSIHVFDTNTGSTIKDLKLGGSSCIESLAISPNGRTLYVGDPLSKVIRVVDTATMTQSDPIQVGQFTLVQDLALTPDGAQLLAATSKGVIVIDTAGKQVVRTIDVGANVLGLVVMLLPPSPAALVSAAAPEIGPSPGSLVSIYGTDLAHGSQSASASPLPATLLETSVFFNNVRAPLLFVSAEQINAQVPYEIAAGPLAVRVERTYPSPDLKLILQDVSPSIFIHGTAAIAAHASTFAPVSETAPAHPGEDIVLYATGLGRLKQNVPTGVAATQAVETVSEVRATVGGLSAPVSYAGLAPGFPGVYQVNLRVPDDVAAGNGIPVVLSMGPVRSNTAGISVQ